MSVDAVDSSSNHTFLADHLFTVETAVPPPVVTLVAAASTWSYEDSGSDLGTGWRSVSFNDGSWTSGPAELGFGDRSEATVTAASGFTTYFRHSFGVADAAAVTGLDVDVIRDDGAVVYLNGVEVFRTNMPDGVITYATKASSDISGSGESQWHRASIDESLLVDGVNTLAVEVHDRKTKNKDLSFDLRLVGETGEPDPAGPTVGPRAITCPAGAVDILPGDNVAAAATANAAGTTFCLKPGTYLNQSVQPKAGQTFLGELGAILNGNDSTAHAFSGSASGVTIENLVIENYTTIAQFGAVNGEGADWRVVHNDVRNNAGVGVFVDGNRATIQNNFIHQNHQLGISLTFSADSVVEDNEISYNNWLGEYEWGWEAGGTKFWTTTNLIVRGNESHDNLGPGLWSDTDNIDILYENNVVHENRDAPGIFHEIGYDAIIRNNHIWDNGWPDTMPSNPYWQRGAIQIAGSSNVEVHGNLIEDSAKGIIGIDQCRGTGLYGPWALLNVSAHDNTIDNSNLSTAESDCGSTIDFVFENNTLLGNSYIQ
jgi:parallel beta-helix repeat protein